MTDSENTTIVKINKLSLMTNIFLALFAFVSLTSTPMFLHFFQGRLEETIIPANFPETHKGGSYYTHIYKYRHTSGNAIKNSTLEFRIENTGSEISDYVPYFKTLYQSKLIQKTYDKKFIKLDIPEIRPYDEFDIVIYSKNKAKLSAVFRATDGVLKSTSGGFRYDPVTWILALISGYFLLSLLYYRRTIRKLEEEKQRIIGERNALQQIVLSGARVSVNRRVK